jgi:hypothetical protein
VNDDWIYNYFNYFTEVETHFQQVRGTSLFLLSPLDWALIESWKNADVPLEAVLRGIDAAFEKWRGRKKKTQMVNSLTFCAQAVMTEAQIMAGTVQRPAHRESAPPFPLDDLRDYLARNAATLRPAAPIMPKSPPRWNVWRPKPKRTIRISKTWSAASPCWRKRL